MAGQPCTLCYRPDRAEIDEAIVSGEPSRAIARRFATSKDAVGRHKARHVSRALAVVVRDRQERAGPATALERLEELYGSARRVLEAAELDGKPGLSLQAIRELRGIVETLAKITGELDDRTQVQVLNVHGTPEWLAIRAAVLEALSGFPAAAVAVSDRLRVLEATR